MTFRSTPFAALALAVLALAGCQTPSFDDPARRGPFFTPVNHAGDPSLPVGLRRVVLLPICGGQIADPESSSQLDPVFATELQKQNRFEVVVLSRAECRRRFGAGEFSSAGVLPHDFLPTLRREFAADAVLWVDLTAFKAYAPLVLGVRAKLAVLDDPRVIWTFDTIFSADDPAVANSARRHFVGQTNTDIPADLTRAALQSPTQFATYVAAEVFATLPLVARPSAVPVANGR